MSSKGLRSEAKCQEEEWGFGGEDSKPPSSRVLGGALAKANNLFLGMKKTIHFLTYISLVLIHKFAHTEMNLAVYMYMCLMS